jgi:general secretion pathway protein J
MPARTLHATAPARARARARAQARGLTLIEVLVAIAVLAMISVLIYSAFSTITRGKTNAETYAERYRLARIATTRMSRELSEAYLSAHLAPTPALVTRVTAFTGVTRRVDFNAFAHRRVVKDAHESDQCELSYFVGQNAKKPQQLDLLRREQVIPDDQPGKGGVVQVFVDDIDTFELKYLDPLSGLWTDQWDSTSAAGQLGRLPLQVEITLIMRGGPAGSPIRLRTKTPIMMPQPLAFALK